MPVEAAISLSLNNFLLGRNTSLDLVNFVLNDLHSAADWYGSTLSQGITTKLSMRLRQRLARSLCEGHVMRIALSLMI